MTNGSRITDNLGLKLVALLLGFSLWYAVAREQGAEFAFSIPIELRNVPEGFEVVEESVQQVEVRLRGPAELLRRITPRDIRVGVDLSDAEPGERIAYLTPRDVEAPFGARVMRVTPTSVQLELDRTLQRTVEIIPRVSGAPAEGYELYDIELSPRTITIVGPAARLRGLDQITTQPVSAEGLREPYSRVVRVELDPLIRLERETDVEITLDVREERLRREFNEVPVEPVPGEVAARVQPQAIRVTVEGPKSFVENLNGEDVEAELPLEGLGPGTHRVVPFVRVPGDIPGLVRVVALEPEEVEVRIPQ